MPMIGGGDCIGGCIVKMMPGMTVTEFPFVRFSQAAAQNPTDGQQCQPDKHQVKINAVVFNQAVQRVENGIELSNSAGFKFMVGSPFQFVSLTPKSQPWRLPASPARFSKAAIFRMPPVKMPGLQAR